MIIKNRDYAVLFGIIILAFFLRVGWSIINPLTFTHDEGTFNIIADSLVNKHIYSYDGINLTSWKSPGYPFFLAIQYFLFGHNYLLVKIIQSFMGALLCLLVYLLGKKFFSSKISLIASFILAIDFSFIQMAETFLSENLYILLFTITILLLSKMFSEMSKISKIALGFSLGLAALVRAEIMFLPFFILCAMFFLPGHGFGNGAMDKMKTFLIILTCFLIPIVPWTIRNYYVHRTPVLISTEGGVALYTSYRPLNGKIFGSEDRKDEVTIKALGMKEAQQNSYYVRETFKYIKENYSAIPKLIILKILYFFSPFEYEFTAGRAVFNFIFASIILFFIIGMISLGGKFIETLPLTLPVVYYFIFGIIFQATPRWRSCVEPFMVIIAANGINNLFNYFKYKIVPYLIIFFVLAVNILIFINADSFRVILRNLLSDLGIW